jgi:hypothetical protein
VIIHFRAQRPLDNPGRQLTDQPTALYFPDFCACLSGF